MNEIRTDNFHNKEKGIVKYRKHLEPQIGITRRRASSQHIIVKLSTGKHKQNCITCTRKKEADLELISHQKAYKLFLQERNYQSLLYTEKLSLIHDLPKHIEMQTI